MSPHHFPPHMPPLLISCAHELPLFVSCAHMSPVACITPRHVAIQYATELKLPPGHRKERCFSACGGRGKSPQAGLMGYPCKICRGAWLHGFCQQSDCRLSQPGGRVRKRDRRERKRMSELRSRSREQRKDRRSHGASQPVSVADERLGEFAPSVVVRPWRERKRMPGSRSRLREQRKDCEKTQPRRARTSRSRSREDREDLWSKLDVDEYAAEERAGKYPFMNIGKRLSRPPRPTCVEEWPQEWPPPKVDVDEDEESEVEDEINEADCVWLSMETAFGIKKWDKVDMKVSDIRLGNRGVFRVAWRQHIAVCRQPMFMKALS